MVVKYHEYWDLLNVDQHSQFESRLKELLFKQEERENFYDRLLEVKKDLSTDTFKDYFELYAAERKTNQQDFTPNAVANLLDEISNLDRKKDRNFTAYDPAAGTGMLLISKWHGDRMRVAPWNYYPHNYFYMAEELSDTAVIYLIHNLALRGMNAVVLHGDSVERKYKQVYFAQNSQDDHMLYSDINVMPHNEHLERMLDIREWMEDSIDYKESSKVIWQGFKEKDDGKTENKQQTLF